MNDIFDHRSLTYNLRSQTDFARPAANIEHYEIESLRYMTSTVWDIVPNDIKNLDNLEDFKAMIRMWEPSKCHCKL